MKAIRSKLAYVAISLAFLGATVGASLAAPGRHVLAGGPAIKAAWTPSGLIEVAGSSFSPSSKVQIYAYPIPCKGCSSS